MGVRLRLMVYGRTLQRRHDLLTLVDREADVAIKQALPALLDADFLLADVAKFVPGLDRDRPFHRHRFLSEQSDADGLLGHNNAYSTPEKLPDSGHRGG